MRPRIRCRVGCGFALFTVISCFCCLYLLGFSQLANASTGRDWLVSSFMSIGVDMLIFEMIPAALVAVLGLLVIGCKASCLVWLIVAIEVYRFLRNFVDT